MNKRLYIKTNSLIYDSIIFINANDKSPLKIDNRIKNTKIFILNFIYYVSWILLLFYELFFLGADASVASGLLLDDSKCTFSNQNILDVADSVHLQRDSVLLNVHQRSNSSSTSQFEDHKTFLSEAMVLSFNKDFNSSSTGSATILLSKEVNDKVLYLNEITKYLKLSVILNLAMGVSNFGVTFMLLIVVVLTKRFLPHKNGDSAGLSPGTQILIDLAQTPSSLVAEMASGNTSSMTTNQKNI